MDMKDVKSSFDEAVSPLRERIRGVEDHIAKAAFLGAGGPSTKSLASIVTESDQFQRFVAEGQKNSGRILIPGGFKNTITSGDRVIAPGDRVPQIISPATQRLTIRDLLRVVPTELGAIEYTKGGEVNLAAPQGVDQSPFTDGEGEAKPESTMTFELFIEPVRTIATWVAGSTQILADAGQLSAYLQDRLTFFIRQVEDQEILTGSGVGGHLNGLITNATAFDTGLLTGGESKIDTLRKAFLQLEQANFSPAAVVLNPSDWADIQLVKDLENRYVFGNPGVAQTPSLWGVPVVSTASIAVDEFLVADLPQACTLYDRQQASVVFSREHSDFFTRNLFAALAELRIALVIYRSDALIFGNFSVS